MQPVLRGPRSRWIQSACKCIAKDECDGPRNDQANQDPVNDVKGSPFCAPTEKTAKEEQDGKLDEANGQDMPHPEGILELFNRQ